MPSVGTRKTRNMGSFAKNPMYAYASQFCEAQQNILTESGLDYATDPAKAMSFSGPIEQMRSFFTENSVIKHEHMTTEEYQDQVDMMNEAFINDVQAVKESAVAGMSAWNPMVGLSLPMHKYLMLNCVFAQALPRFVAKSPSWTEAMETRYMVTPDGKRIDIANQQNEIYQEWKKVNPSKDVFLALPEVHATDILKTAFNVEDNANLSSASCITHVLVTVDAPVAGTKHYYKVEEGVVVDKEAVHSAGCMVAVPWKAEFTPGYGEHNRVIMKPVTIVDPANSENVISDTIFAAQTGNLFDINAVNGKRIKGVVMSCRLDASARNTPTARVEWAERTTFVQIPENDGITVPVTPEEVKDIGAMYGINQVTKYMSMIKDIMENVKDDDIKESLDNSFMRLDDDHRLARTIDFAPRDGFYGTHIQWLHETFMHTLDNFVTGLLTVLRDPNMTISIIGRPALIRSITPVEYSYTTPSNVGPIELDFKKTVVTSDKRVYNFISSDKLQGNDSLIVLLIPKNTNRIVYRLYDYQMYISNEIRDAQNPALPALTAFQRYKFFEYQPVQGRLFCANPNGLRENQQLPSPTVEQAIGSMYSNNDLASVYATYNVDGGVNVTPGVHGA